VSTITVVTWQPGRNDAALERILPGAAPRPTRHGYLLQWAHPPGRVLLLPAGAEILLACGEPLAYRHAGRDRWRLLPGRGAG